MGPQELDLLHMTTALRTQMMELVTDEDLAFQIEGNPTLGQLCRELGDIERMYIESFKTLVMPWGLRSDEPAYESSVAALQAWYAQLDSELDTVLQAIPSHEFQSKAVDRGGGFNMPLGGQFHTYREAILIHCGKCSVYLRALGKTLPLQWRQWIG